MNSDRDDVVFLIENAIQEIVNWVQPMIDAPLNEDIKLAISLLKKQIIKVQWSSQVDRVFLSFLKFIIEIFQHNNDFGVFEFKIQNEIDVLEGEIRNLKVVKNYLKFAKETKQYDQLVDSFKVILMTLILSYNRAERIKINMEVFMNYQRGITYIHNFDEIDTIDNCYRNFINKTVKSLEKCKIK